MPSIVAPSIVQAFIVLWIMMPAYLANTIAVITGGRFPIDQGKKWEMGTEFWETEKLGVDF